MSETELWLAVAPGRLARVRAQAHCGSQPTALDVVYFDTAGGDLANAGISIGLSRAGRSWTQTLDVPGRSTAERRVDIAQGARSGRGEAPVVDATLHQGTPAGDALAELLAAQDWTAAPLEPRFRMAVVRYRRVLRVAGSRIEFACDAGSIEAGQRVQAIRELGFKLKAGGPQGMFAEARRWVEHHGLWIESRSRAARGNWLSRGQAGGPPVRATLDAPRDVRAARDELALLRAIVGHVLHQVLANASEVAAGLDTVDHVHQLRVGLRRLRTALRVFGAAAPALGACEKPLAQVFRGLGSWRDAGVTRDTIAPRLREAGAPDIELPPTDDERRSPVRLSRGKALQLALLQLMEFAATQPAPDAQGPKASSRASLDAALDARLNKLHKQVISAGRQFDALSLDEQHRTRKRLKRLRYLAEFVAPRYKRSMVKRYLAALEPAQDALGAHNDAAVALARYQALASKDREALFAVGWLTARLEQTVSDSRQALSALSEARRFWR